MANAIERAKILSDDGSTIESKDFPPDIMNGVTQPSHGEFVHSNELDAINKVHVEATYLKFEKNKSRTAQALGVSRRSLYRLLEKYEIE